ncbi:uncharacterized protein PHACADRAFT_260640 [Phanerochaete carnosa HHB-10118-sp]|uniref:Amidohydrolase-related domain-containing protein n=1 Tax=Phanerochaete carnosa (strain HHB-10118-sp) TaxID=650164 RepID=K5UR51_PHACS|nr:uncharacterized protein PHACADRAFT_260640 [Phanerochaete carnosa HHB-10118-sp]EKM52321.1 hypothetical protein PHACADRAFT_260640 [Phanerochaete carnosa HHB-10118-sp]
MNTYGTAELARVALSYPAIDNHAHPLLKAEHRSHLEFEGLVSEATGQALTQDAIHTLACFRATAQLGQILGLKGELTWEKVKQVRDALDYDRLCRVFMEATGIQCILIDDGLGGSSQYAEDYKWHDRFTRSPTKRIVRVEALAETLLKEIFDSQLNREEMNPYRAYIGFIEQFYEAVKQFANDPEVAGFKSVACYRTGLNIGIVQEGQAVEHCVTMVMLRYEAQRTLRLVDKPLNDYIVNITLRVAGECGKPVQFHTGLGDSDITLALSSPAQMQSIIKSYPETKFVLLHSSYPYTRDAGYLTAVYPNVFLDFGEVFPFLSADGQCAVVKQVLELAPTNKIMWSTDGHWWPESYYLGTRQAREALWKVLAESVAKQDLTESQAIGIVKGALFDNANRIYDLGLAPNWLDN